MPSINVCIVVKALPSLLLDHYILAEVHGCMRCLTTMRGGYELSIWLIDG